ncbi:MAG: ABC-type amino acid transport substrate-binding protein [Cognaticolwellia sp.]|jgi:ABC-type amino acid transport substrate-binding protein
MFHANFNRFTLITMLLVLSVSAQAIKPTYQVAINKTYYPYHFVNDKQNPNGTMVELWQLWAEKQDVKVEFITLNWQQTIKQVQEGKVDIHAGLSKNSSRAEVLDFSSVFFRQDIHLFYIVQLHRLKIFYNLHPILLGLLMALTMNFLLRISTLT